MPRTFGHQRVRRIEHSLSRSVVVFEGDDRRRSSIVRPVLIRKPKDVADRRGSKRIDRLRIVTDDGDAITVLPQPLQNFCLQHVCVLVFVDEDVIELAADICREPIVAHHRVPVQQQVVVVERLIGELFLHIRAVELVSCASHSAHQGNSPSSVSASGRCVLTRCE